MHKVMYPSLIFYFVCHPHPFTVETLTMLDLFTYMLNFLLFLSVPASSDTLHQPNRYSSQLDGHSYDYSRRVFGATLDSISRTRSRYHDSSNPITYPSY